MALPKSQVLLYWDFFILTFFGTFWGLFITFNQGLEIWNFLFSGLSFQKSHIPLLSCLFAQVLTLFKKLELGDVTREMSSSEVGLRVFKVYHVFQDFLGSIKDVNMKEIIAKESLEYQVTSPRTILGMSSKRQKYVSRNGGIDSQQVNVLKLQSS